MSYNNQGIISAPVELADVIRAVPVTLARRVDGNTVRISSSSLGVLCRAKPGDTIPADDSGSNWTVESRVPINKWAKYKPVTLGVIDTTGQLNSNNTWKDTATWWRGDNGNCGISYTSFSTITAAIAAIANETAIWSYEMEASAFRPYRLIDFNQYEHYAKSPTTSVGSNDAQMKANAELKVMVATSVAQSTWLKLSHIGSLDRYYFMLAVCDSAGNIKFLHTSSRRIGEYAEGETIEITVPYNNGAYGYQGKLTENVTYKGYVMMSSIAYTCDTSAQSGVYIPLPVTEGDYGMKGLEIRCLKSTAYATVDAFADGLIVSWRVDVYADGMPGNVTLRLIYARTKQIVTGQSKTINFNDGATVIQGGYSRQNTVRETLTCPDDNIDEYMLEYVSSSMTVRAIIGHDINVQVTS